MSESELVTFTAAKDSTGYAPAGADGNDAIGDIRAKIVGHGDVYPASSLLDIITRLRTRQTPPTTIQIVGHGTPGALGLAYYWTNTYAETQVGPYFLLDSNPYAYGLLSEVIGPGSRVVIAGCNVGADSPSSPTVAGGSTLIFSLYRMWGCDVFAADDMVDADDFDAGYFVGSAVGMTSNGWTRVQPQKLFAPPIIESGPFVYKDVQITLAPALGPRLEVASESRDGLLDEYQQEIKLDQRPLALDEVRLHGFLNEVEHDFYLMAASTIVQAVPVDETQPVRYLRAPRSSTSLIAGRMRPPAGAAVWSAVREALAKQLA